MNQEYVTELAKTFAQLASPSEVEQFLRAILTPQELDDVSRRLQIVKQLKQGVPQRTIADNLGVGIATVTRGSREIKQGNFEHVT